MNSEKYSTADEAWREYLMSCTALDKDRDTEREMERDRLRWCQDRAGEIDTFEPDSGCIIEIRETYRRLQGHFQMFGFLTSASFDDFMARVISPHATSRSTVS